MTIQIIRKNGRYWIRARRFMFWLTWSRVAWWPKQWEGNWTGPIWKIVSVLIHDSDETIEFSSYAEARNQLDKILVSYMKQKTEEITERISPIVIEDSREL